MNTPDDRTECSGAGERARPTPSYPSDLCVPEHVPGAIRFLEQHARITKLPGGGWRVWLRSAGIRVYGSTRWSALEEAAGRVQGRSFNELLST